MKTRIVLMLVFCFCSCGFAASIPQANHGGLYVDLQGGIAQLDTIKKGSYLSDAFVVTSSKRNQFAWGFHAGYLFPVASHFLVGVQLGFNDNGYSKFRSAFCSYQPVAKVKSNDINLLLSGMVVWNTGWNVFAKGGVAYVHQDERIVSGQAGPANPNEEYEPVVAIGFGHFIRSRWNLFVEYRHIFATDQSTYKKMYKTTGQDFNGVANVDVGYFGIAYCVS